MARAATSKDQPLIIYAQDPEMGTRVITLAFALIRKNAMRGIPVICAVGEKNGSYIRPAVEATWAKLYVEPIP